MSKQGYNLNPNYTSKVEIALPGLDATENVTRNLNMDDLQDNQRNNMILGRDILSKLITVLNFSDNTIRVNGCTYKGCTTPIKDVSRINFKVASNWLKQKIFWND